MHAVCVPNVYPFYLQGISKTTKSHAGKRKGKPESGDHNWFENIFMHRNILFFEKHVHTSIAAYTVVLSGSRNTQRYAASQMT